MLEPYFCVSLILKRTNGVPMVSHSNAIITPILKKPTADQDEVNNFRPISNLPYIAKLLEKVVVHRLRKHKPLNGLYKQCQSVYRPGHSTETAVLKVLFVCLFMYTASVMFDYYCRDSELSYFGGIGFQSTPPLEGAGVFNVPEGDSPQNTEPPFIA